ncbi:type II secretion system protein GspK [Stieleria varia]|uniref:General secretion pathway protein K n=1 Tax=Stieleria varia TaxID=2528005 RepID=A0A5C6B7B8_9BACT|nr:type II secretion system protein GspK [Stieleria varia]TWU07687.1 General secretion pathway protein K [Stieleria varia]
MRKHTPRGFFLVLVLIVIVVATMAVFSFSGVMLAFDESAYLSGDLVQARVTVESGAEAVRMILSQPPDLRTEQGGLYNNPNMFQAVTASTGADGVTACNFSIVAPDLTDTGMLGGLRFGLVNESAKLNLNTLPILEKNSDALMVVASLGAAEDASAEDALASDNLASAILLALPGMTEDLSDAILDWLDEDDEPRPYGAEFDYYAGLSTPYEPTNGPVLSVEELLLVRGMTPNLLFGADTNRNGMLDPDEQQRFNATVDTPGALGLAAYFTVHGSEASKRRDGSFRVNINQDDLEALYDELVDALGDETYASFICAYRMAGQPSALSGVVSQDSGGGNSDQGNNNQDSSAPSGGVWTSDLLGELDLSAGGGTDFTQVLDLIDATVTVGNGDNARSYQSPFDLLTMGNYLPIIMDALTTQDSETMPGRININECPAELLYGIPMLTEEQVQAILEARMGQSDDPNRFHETWPMVEGIVTLDQMRQLTPLLTAGGDIYRAQIVGYYEAKGISQRHEIIIDATTVNPKIVMWRDLSHLGRGFDVSVLGIRSTVNLPNQ